MSVERSFAAFGTGSDWRIVLLHSSGEDEQILRQTDAVETLTRLKEAGKIGAIGISTKTVAGGRLAFNLGLDVVMATYNPWYQRRAAGSRHRGRTWPRRF